MHAGVRSPLCTHINSARCGHCGGGLESSQGRCGWLYDVEKHHTKRWRAHPSRGRVSWRQWWAWLQVWVYEEGDAHEAGNMYVHHDLMLSSFPLALAWGDCHPDTARANEKGNFVAIGTFSPEIEVWDLDTLDSVEPAGVLGGARAPAGKG